MSILASLKLDKYFSNASVNICMNTNNQTIEVPFKNFSLIANNKEKTFTSVVNNILLCLYGTVSDGGTKLYITASGSNSLNIKSIAIHFTYKSSEDLSLARVPTGYSNVFASGMKLLGKECKTGPDSMLCGLFLSYNKPCLFLGTLIPQKSLHYYSTVLIDNHNVSIKSETIFTYGQSLLTELSTESIWISGDKNPIESITAWNSNFETLLIEDRTKVITGWNSWDYYYSTISHQDIMENVTAIKNDPTLSNTLKYIVIDDGWQHKRGEWKHNYKFPKGMKYTAEKIKENGFTPGIWMSPLLVDSASILALRHKEMLIKDEYNDPQSIDGTFLLDPTHPSGAEYLYNTFRDLYNDGYRLFKVDFVNTITYAYTFHKQDVGSYEAIRELFTIIRSAVTNESHVIGCAYPGEAGGGFVDSRRIGVDIHNHWSHVEWVTEYLQLCFWEQDKIAPIDPDFIIVRAPETSLEKETEVTHFDFNRQKALGKAGGRWRAGDVWNITEAQTWVNLVSFTGGSRFLSDRISMLNSIGKDIIYNALNSPVAIAIPLDLGEKPLAEFWLQDINGKQRILIVNFSEEARKIEFDARHYGLSSDTCVSVLLDSHASVIIDI